VARLLLGLGGSEIVNARNADGRTPLLIAAKNGNAAVVKLLAGQPSAHINVVDNLGITAYSWALQENHEAITQILEQAVSSCGAGCDSREQRLPQAEVGALAALPTAVGRLHLDRPDYNRNVALSSAPQKMIQTTAPKCHGKWLARHRAARETKDARLCVKGDETVQLCATIGELGSTVRVSTRRRGDRLNSIGWTEANVVTFDAADAPASLSSTKLSLPVRIRTSSSQ
jgi:hypothetical protein